MPTLLQDLRYGLRTLVKTPVVTGVALLSLALGIAANATIFAVLNAFLFEPLPYHDQDGLVLVGERRAGESVENFRGISIANLRDYEAAATTLDGVMAYSTGAANLTGLDVPERIRMVSATPNVLDVLGVQPALGRGFRADEGDEGRGRVLVLDHEFWMRRFLGDREVLGRTLTLDGVGHTVVGVMPEAFDLIPADVDV
jgi:putative ABC transport system permease protein